MGAGGREGPAQVLPAPEAVALRLFVTPWTAAHQAPPSMGFSRREHWSGVPSPSPEAVALPAVKTQSRSDASIGAEGGGGSQGQQGVVGRTWRKAEPTTSTASPPLGPSQSRLFLLGAGRRPQLPRPVGKRAAVRRQDAAIGVMSEEPADAGFEGVGGRPPLRLRFLLLPRPLLPPVADAHAPVQNWGWNKEKRRGRVSRGPWAPGVGRGWERALWVQASQAGGTAPRRRGRGGRSSSLPA